MPGLLDGLRPLSCLKGYRCYHSWVVFVEVLVVVRQCGFDCIDCLLVVVVR